MLACAHRPSAPAATAPPLPASPVQAAPQPVSPWAAVPVRVMSWTPHGVRQIGSLPGALPQPMPERWYVEPIHKLDEATLGRLVGLVRSEHVPGLSLRGQAVAAWLSALRDLPELGALVLDGTDVDGAALAATELSLTRLYLAHTAIDDATIAEVVARHPALEVLDVEDTAVGDAGARAIARLTGLRATNLAATQLTDAGGAALGALTQLEIIDLGETRVGAATVAALRQLPLHDVFLDHTRVRGEVASLAALAPRLQRFDISGTAHHPNDQELGWLATAPNLIELGVSGAKLHDPLALTLAALPALREVRMATTKITLATIRVLAARSDLEEIDLADTPVDDASAAALLAAPHVRVVRLDGTPIGDAALAGAPGAELTELFVSHTTVGDRGLEILDRAPHLVALGVGHTQVGEPTLARIARLVELRTVVLSSVGAPPEALARLASLAALERVYLDRTHADDTTIAAFAPARDTLRVLHLAGSDVSDDGLAALRALTALEELTVGDTRMHGGISELSAWPRLRTLSLTGLDLGDKAVPSLAARRSLVVLDLSATDVHDPSPLAALPRLRTLGVAQNRLSAAGLAAVKRLIARGVEVVR